MKKVKVMASAIHPNRREGEVYEIIEIQALALSERGFVIYPIEEGMESSPDPILPKKVKIIKPISDKQLKIQKKK